MWVQFFSCGESKLFSIYKVSFKLFISSLSEYEICERKKKHHWRTRVRPVIRQCDARGPLFYKCPVIESKHGKSRLQEWSTLVFFFCILFFPSAWFVPVWSIFCEIFKISNWTWLEKCSLLNYYFLPRSVIRRRGQLFVNIDRDTYYCFS